MLKRVQARAATWSDFIALPDGDRRELVGGRLLEIDVPTQLHEHIVAMFIYWLTAWRKAGGGGRVLSSGFKVRIDEESGFMPDVQYFKPGRFVPDQALTEGGPDLAIEVISPSSARFDRVEKLNGYASIGTAEYWLVDPENRTLHRYLLRGKVLTLAAIHTGDELFCPPTFHGLEVTLAELWTLPR